VAIDRVFKAQAQGLERSLSLTVPWWPPIECLGFRVQGIGSGVLVPGVPGPGTHLLDVDPRGRDAVLNPVRFVGVPSLV